MNKFPDPHDYSPVNDPTPKQDNSGLTESEKKLLAKNGH
jgi:hypothetical protein